MDLSTLIETRIKTALPDATIELQDQTGTGNHYAAHVVSAQFRGKSRIQQHQMIYAALGDALDGPLHALALRTEAPE